ncbi:Tetratricopeptide TPR_1 repeat-containing protein [Spirochaeta thermophila DSM 6578]|uniref:Tetratricopeptide TPR_1 repeat-containing protein n=1 Tax=Winmispira thermophila (strain ATCC 700085 / DSM 6578 / Z-1203) TaxID=869211 RepID=G0GBY5_WINT7|nr:tetratricopeptide repeat protein [Spirochaeta thermophila]AEJ61996.1 Tetratricopeptide TPR_1 repeat-containing protein [Spirochaeta thermophila DSM 6578]
MKGSIRAGIPPLLFLVLLLLPGCTQASFHLKMLQGAYAYSRGHYQDALVAYLSFADLEGEEGSVIAYNLGTVYHALGDETAFAKWKQAESARDPETRFSAFYNLGLYYYDHGEYQNAYLYFLQALRLEPDDRDVRVNLELAYLKLSAFSAAPQVSEPGGTGDEPPERGIYLLDYLRKKEQARWKAREFAPPEGTWQDW